MNYSDVIQTDTLIATFTGFLLIYSTFILQARTFQQQQKLTDLELKKFLLSIRPEFSFSIRDKEGRQTIIDRIFFHYEIKLERNVALDFSIRNLGPILDQQLQERRIDYIKVDKEFPIVNGQLPLSIITSEIALELHFTDEIGTTYKQIINGDIYDLHISPTLPR